MSRHQPLSDLIADFRNAVPGDAATLGAILDNTGQRSFAMAILMTALVLITPVSGVPTVPTLGGTIIFLAAAQRLLGRNHLWLPQFLLGKRLSADKIAAALRWLDPLARRIDRVTRPRLGMLTGPVADRIVLLTIMLVVLPWPLLELLPFVTSTGAVIVACLAFGLLVNDGLFVLAGYLVLAALPAVAFALA